MTAPPYPSLEFTPGTVFAGDFTVERKLGEGGMGAVYLVHQRSTGMRRALKVMAPRLLERPDLWERFEREARISAKIRSEHVVKVITAGIDTTHIPYLVMEYLEGEPLDRRLWRGPLPPSEARLVFGQLCHGLAEMHALGIVHRDIKPENIFVAHSHRADVPFTVKLLDFGIAKELGGMALSSTTQAIGTPRTMAPEQADPRRPVTPATDVWALGLVAFMVLTGKSFWLSTNHPDGTLQGLITELLNLPIPPPSRRLGELGVDPSTLPAGFDAWFARCLERDPAHRYPDAAAAWAALSEILDGPPVPLGAFDPDSARSRAPSTQRSAEGPGAASIGALAFAATAPPPSSQPTPQPTPQPRSAPQPTPLSPQPSWPPSMRTSPLPGALGPHALPPPVAGSPPGSPPASPPAGSQALPPGSAAGLVVAAPELPAAVEGSGLQVVGASTARGATGVEGPAAAGPGSTRQRRLAKALLLAAGVLLGAAGALAWWARPRTLYCRDVLLTRLDVVCLGELRPEQAARRAQTYRLQRSKGKARRAELINGRGFPVATEAGLASWGYHYGRGGVLEQIEAHDAWGQPQLRLRYLADQGRIEVRGPGGEARIYPGSHHSVEEVEFDVAGRVSKVRYLTSKNAPATDAHGAFGYRHRFDERGRLVERTALGSDGQPSYDARWIQRLERRYDEQGEVIEERFFTTDGKPGRTREGCALQRYERDEAGNLTRVTCLDAEAKPTYHADGYGGWMARYDGRGNAAEVRRLGPDGATVHDRIGVASELATHDERGRPLEVRYLAIDGSPTLNAQGVAGWRARYDERGDRVEQTFLDASGKPTLHRDGYATMRTRHDERHRLVEVSYLDTEGKPTYHEEGYASQRLSYDERDNVVERALLDTEGKPTLGGDRYATLRVRYDERRQPVEEHYLGLDGRATRTAGWYAARLRRYDDRGNEVETSLLGPDGKPTRHREGWSAQRRRFNEHNQVTEVAHFNPEGNPTRTNKGVAVERYRLDALGRLVERSNHDAEGRPAPDDDGEVTERLRLDERGFVEERLFVDAYGQPLASRREGYARRKTRNDALGRPLEHAYFGADGAPRRGPAGAEVERLRYDERGNLVEQALFDAAGQPTAGAQGAALLRWKHDARGTVIEWAYFDARGRPTMVRDGYAVVRTSLDAKGRQIEWIYLDAEGGPARYRGYHQSRASYDARGRRLEVTYHDEAGAHLSPEGKGAPVRRYLYDARGNLVDEALLGADGKPFKGAPVCRRQFVYDERDLLVETRPYGPDGQPSPEHLLVRTRYDDRGQRVELSYFDASGQAAVAPSGVSVERLVRDEQGRLVEQSFFDHLGQPTRHRELRAARLKFFYDDLGRKREEQRLDEAGKVLKIERGNAG